MGRNITDVTHASRAQVDAEALSDIADQFDISVVPTFVFIKVSNVPETHVTIDAPSHTTDARRTTLDCRAVTTLASSKEPPLASWQSAWSSCAPQHRRQAPQLHATSRC